VATEKKFKIKTPDRDKRGKGLFPRKRAGERGLGFWFRKRWR